MTFLGNIIWLIFGGFFASLGYIFGGLMLMISIIGIPFGIQSIKIGIANLAPFGKQPVATEQAGSLLSIVFNAIWLILFGWEIALVHLVSGVILLLTIIGIPFAKQHFKLIPLALAPFGRKFV